GPNNVLVSPANPVPNINSKIKEMINQMRTCLEEAQNPQGVGLAAAQIGLPWRIFLMWPNNKETIRVIINPEYVNKSSNLVKGITDNRLEGCLSVPHVWGAVERHTRVTISYLDDLGQKQQNTFSGFPAIIVQHEMDHLDGILFTRRVIEQKGTLYKPGVDDLGKEVLEPIEI
ncbi:MAG: peptide deformylase, partial [Patescibacteria group bacterium]